MQKIVPCLWFDKEAEEAIKFYIEIFNSAPNSPKELDDSEHSTLPRRTIEHSCKGDGRKNSHGYI